MLENCKTAQERWGGTHEMIDRWLAGRQQALITYFGLQDVSDEEQHGKVQTFCQKLVDYVSEGHFEIYEQLFREAKEFDDGGLELAKKLYPKIEKTTQLMLNFNDKYESIDGMKKDAVSFKSDLSTIGERMTERFELEDQLIERLHTIHKKELI